MLSTKLKTVAVLAAGLASVLLSASVGKANSIEVGGVTTTLTAGVWDYAYSMVLSPDNSISATNPNGNSLFVFYDVIGLTGAKASFVAGTTSVSDWNIFVEPTSGNWSAGLSSIVSQGGTAVENDLAGTPNVRYQYVGRGLASGDTVSEIGTAHLYSTGAPGLYGQFAARWIGISGNTQVNTQTPLMPVASSGAPQSVPLPAAVWMGVSMIAVGFFARVRRHHHSAIAS